LNANDHKVVYILDKIKNKKHAESRVIIHPS